LTKNCFGLADGVGGWSKHGINPADFSHELMRKCKNYTNQAYIVNKGIFEKFRNP